MSCERVEPHLLAFHFGAVSPDERAAVERHLLGCRACLDHFLALKRSFELAEAEPQLLPAPSPESRQRLRREVALALGRPGDARSRSWERPLAVAVAVAALLLAVVTTHGLFSGPGAPPRSSSPSTR